MSLIRCLQRPCSNRARFFDSWLRPHDGSRHTPSGSSIGPTEASSPGATAAPEERWYRAVSKRISQNRGCRRQSPDGLGCGRSAVAAAGDSDPASNSVQLVVAPVTERGLPDRRRLPGKQRVTSNGLPSFQNVIAGAHRLVRQRLGSFLRSWNAWPRGKSALRSSLPQCIQNR